jgi:hypothetical protein
MDVATTPTFEPGEEKMLFSRTDYSYDYDVTADGQRFVMIRDQAAAIEGGLVIVQNFLKDLEIKVGN